jgi:hypothetical protein
MARPVFYVQTTVETALNNLDIYFVVDMTGSMIAKDCENGQARRYEKAIDDIIAITFQASDSSVNYGMKCLKDETFAEVEEKLYKKYNDLRNTNNMFTANAKPILRFKTINENNIKDGDIIQLFRLE